jgi:hypothetical protein
MLKSGSGLLVAGIIAMVLCFLGLLWALATMLIQEPDGTRRPNAPTFTMAQVQYGLIHHRAQWANRTVWLHAWLEPDCPPDCELARGPDEPRYGFADIPAPLPYYYLENHGLALGSDSAPTAGGVPGWIAGLPLIGAPLARAWPSRVRAGLGYYRVQLYSTLGIGCNRDAQPWCAVATLLP